MDTRWKRPKKRRMRGLGDIVHAIAQPIAMVMDTVAGTDFGNCRDCTRRRDEWNRRFPLASPVDRRDGE